MSNENEIKYTVSCLREKHCNYEDKTPNEPRYDKNGKIDSTVYYPLGDVYPTLYAKNLVKLPYVPLLEMKEVSEEWFLETLTYQRIRQSISYLQPEALKKYLIKNYKFMLLGNPFCHLIGARPYDIEKNKEAILTIIKILIENYDDYEELVEELPIQNTETIRTLIYSQMPTDENRTMCSICLDSRPAKRLINPCDCKTPIHIECLLQLEQHKRLDKCSVCTGKYKVNQPVSNGSIRSRTSTTIDTFFPHNDFYPTPLSSSKTLHKATGMDRLDFAIMYLQIDRVKELLKLEEIIEGLKDHYLGYKPYKQTPLIALAQGNIGDNCGYSCGSNYFAYISIFARLLQTNKIDIDAVDAFGKKVDDYLEEKKHLNILKEILIAYREKQILLQLFKARNKV